MPGKNPQNSRPNDPGAAAATGVYTLLRVSVKGEVPVNHKWQRILLVLLSLLAVTLLVLHCGAANGILWEPR